MRVRRSGAIVVAAILLASLVWTAAHGPTPSGSALFLRLATGAEAGTYRAPAGDRCVVHRTAGSESLVYYSLDAEAQPPGAFALFYVIGYHGPGTYRVASTSGPYGPRSATFLTWSLSRWDRYAGEVDVVVERDAGGQLSGSLRASLYSWFGNQQAQSFGDWRCTTADETAPVITSAPTSTVAARVESVAFHHPADWHVDAGCPFPATAYQLVADVSPQPLLELARRFRNEEACIYPVAVLHPGSVLITWSAGFLPGSSPEPPPGATPVASGAGPGWAVIDPDGCLDLLGDEQIVVVLPRSQLRIEACVRGPDVPLLRSEAMDVILSTSVTGA